jgi:WD40 repeat protein
MPCGPDGTPKGPFFVRSLESPNVETKIPSGPGPFAWGPDGKSITLVNRKGGIEIRDLPSGDVVRVFSRKSMTISALAYSKNGRSVFALASDGSNSKSRLYSYDSETGEERVASAGSVSAFSMATNAVSTCARGEDKIDIRRFSLKLRRSVKLPYKCGWHSLSPDASLVLTYNPKGKRLEARDTDKGSILWSR